MTFAVIATIGCAADRAAGPAELAPVSARVQPATLAMSEGDTARFRLELLSESGSVLLPAASTSLSWMSSAPSIATVDASGKVFALRRGQSSITGIAQGASLPSALSASAIVTVAATPASILVLGGNQQRGVVGTPLADSVVVRVVDRFGEGIAGVATQFSAPAGGSPNPAVVVTDTQGVARTRWTLASRAGAQSLEVRVSSITAPSTVQAVAQPGSLSQLAKLSGDQQTVEPSSAIFPTVQGSDAYGNPVPNAAVTWSISAGGGTVVPSTTQTDSLGRTSTKWSPAQPGSGALLASSGSASATFVAVVNAPTSLSAPSGLAATPTSSTTVMLSWGDNSTSETAFQVEMQTGGGAFAAVGSVGPNVTTFTQGGLAPATAYGFRVRACDSTGCSSYSGIATVTTPATTVPVRQIDLTPASVTLAIGATQQVTATTRDANGNVLAGRVVTFAVGDPSVATVSASGLVTGVSVGTTTLGAVSEGVTASAPIQVTATSSPPSPPSALTATAVSSAQVNLAWTDNSANETSFEVEMQTGAGQFARVATLPGNTAAYSATGLSASTSYGFRVRACVNTACSSYTNVATATTPAGGSSGGSVRTVTITPSSLDIVEGVQQQLTVTLQDSAGNVVTGRAIAFSTGDGTVAVVSQTGLAQAKGAGTTTISATSEGVTGRISVQVAPAAPTNLRVTGTAAQQISIAWDDNSSKETGFEIEAWSPYPTFGLHAQVGTNVTTYQDFVALGTFTSYRVRACLDRNCSAYSNVVQGTTSPQPAGLPVVGTDLPTFGFLFQGHFDPNTCPCAFSFLWGFLPDLSDGAPLYQTRLAGTNIFTGTAPNLSANKFYYYQAVALNQNGTSRGSIVGVYTGVPRNAPTNIQLSYNPALLGVNVSWTWTGATGDAVSFWTVYRRDAASSVWTKVAATSPTANVMMGSATGSMVDTTYDVSVGHTFFYRVDACNAAPGCTPSTDVISIATPALPAASGLSITGSTANSVSLSWSNNGTVGAPVVLRHTPFTQYPALTPANCVSCALPPGTTAFTDGGLAAGQKYTYEIVEIAPQRSVIRTALPSNEVSITMPTGGLPPPTVVTDPPSATHQLVGHVLPNGLPTAAWFEWGTDPALAGASATPARDAGSSSRFDFTEQPALVSGTIYYYRAVGQSAAGVSRGAIVSFVAP